MEHSYITSDNKIIDSLYKQRPMLFTRLMDMYSSVHIIDLNSNTFTTEYMSAETKEMFSVYADSNFVYTDYQNKFNQLMVKSVHPDDLDMVLFALDIQNIKQALSQRQRLSVSFRRIVKGREAYFDMTIISLNEGNEINYALLSFMENDDIVRYEEEYKKNLEHEVQLRISQLKHEKEKIERISLDLAETLSHTLEVKDTYTNGHSKRVAVYSRMLAKKMGLSEMDQKDIYFVGLLHDIGKIGVPKSVINKPGALSDDEYEALKKHTLTGGHILRSVSSLPSASIGARWHHERYDGNGYPDKLSGEDIPLFARIIGVADAYDAMTSKRSYRDILPQEVVRSEIERNIGTQFDPQIATYMLELIDKDTDFNMREHG